MKWLLLALTGFAHSAIAFAQSASPVLNQGDVVQASVGDTIIVNPDALPTSALSVFAPPAVTVASAQSGHGGGFITYLVNNAPTNTNALPSALSAWGDLPIGATGNIVFGGYSLASIEAATGAAIGHEVTVRNNTTRSADINLPPNLAIGTRNVATVGENLTCGGTANCSIGLNVTSEGGSSQAFNTGVYVGKYGQFGVVVEANGGATAMVAKSGNSGLSLHLQNTGTFNATAAVMDYSDSSSVVRFTLKQDGSITTAGNLTVGKPVVLAAYTVSTLPPCNSAIMGGTAYVTDATAPTYNGLLTGGGSVAVPVFCNGSAWTSH